jgi:flavin-dependent dehydrogenase
MANYSDVVVIGGGPAGCVTAMLLARGGCSVVIVDRSRIGGFCIGETLPPQALHLLTDLELSEAFEAQGHRFSPGIVSVWGDTEPLATDFLFSPWGRGCHIDRAKFNAMLLEAAITAGAAICDGTEVASCVEENYGWDLRISCHNLSRSLKCSLLVDARGRRPATVLGFPRRTKMDRLVAVAGLCAPALGACPSDYTLVEAVDEGWFYSAMLPRGDYIVAYMTDADLFAVARHSWSHFLQNQLLKAPHTRDRIERVPAALTVYSAITTFKDTVVRRNWIAVGDAARSYDPLSGLGLWTAMKTASAAVPVIVAMLEGNLTTAIEYETEHRQAFALYLKAYRTHYGQERRWPQSTFWARRQQ